MAVVAICTGCVRKPVTAPVALVPETVPSELRVAAAPGSHFGDMAAMGVGLSSGSTATYLVSGARIFAVDHAGRRIAPLSVDEAVRQAGGASELVAGLQGAGGGAFLAGLLGAVPGALIGAANSGAHGAGTGAAVGAAIGLTVGAIAGFSDSKAKTEREITNQLHGLHLSDHTLAPGIPVRYPAG